MTCYLKQRAVHDRERAGRLADEIAGAAAGRRVAVDRNVLQCQLTGRHADMVPVKPRIRRKTGMRLPTLISFSVQVPPIAARGHVHRPADEDVRLPAFGDVRNGLYQLLRPRKGLNRLLRTPAVSVRIAAGTGNVDVPARRDNIGRRCGSIRVRQSRIDFAGSAASVNWISPAFKYWPAL